MKHIQWKKLLLCIAIPLATGGIAALLTGSSMEKFSSLNQPPLSPPGWLFPVVWSILYVLMGIASYLVWVSGKPNRTAKRTALRLYAVQLAMNFLWPLLFFRWEMYSFAFAWLVLLWVLVIATALRFHAISAPAGWLFLPYILWVTFAGYLNLSIAILN